MRHLLKTNYLLSPEIKNQIPWLRAQLLTWFQSHNRSFPWREPTRTSYELLVAEIMLQRTIATNVAKIYPLFLERYPSWAALLKASNEELGELLKPLGLWRLKVQVFKVLALNIEKRGGVVPSSREELQKIDGIGQYTASVILTTLYGQSEPFLDVNMARLLERFFGPREHPDIRDDSYLHTLSHRLVTGENSLLVNWAVLDFSALVCRPSRPQCDTCPLQDKCRFYNQRTSSSPNL